MSISFEHIQEEIASMLAIPDEEFDEEQRQLMDAYLDELASQEADKVDAFAQFLKIQAALAEACKQEGERLKAKARTAENKIAFLKDRYLAIMQVHGLKKVKGNAYSLSIRESEQVQVDDLGALKLALPNMVRVRVEESADKTAIRDAIKSGVFVPGCRLQKNASLMVR